MALPRVCMQLLVWTISCFPCASTATDIFTLTEVAEGIHVHQGAHLEASDTGSIDDIANIGFIIGSRCIAVIDTGNSAETGRQLRQAIGRISPLPICYIINTHIHLDHILGNSAFLGDNAEFAGHYRLPAAVDANQRYYDQAQETSNSISEPKVFIPPTLLVKDTATLDLGDRVLELTALPSGHTDQDLIIKDKKTGTLWLGDVLFMERIPRIYGSLNGWINTLEKLEGESAGKVIPGHGPVSADWPDAAYSLLHYLQVLRSDVRKAISEGAFMEDAIRTAGQSEREHWLLFEHNHQHNVTRAFAELEWE